MLKRGAGFTLLEMLVAAFILVVLLALGTPDFLVFVQNMQIRSAAENMQAGLNLARTEALRRNQRVSLWLVDRLAAPCQRSAAGTSWVVSLDDPAGRCHQPASERTAPRLIQSRSVNGGSRNVDLKASARAPQAVANCVTFNGFGQVEASCGDAAPLERLVFSSAVAPAATRPLEVRVTTGGAIRMCDPAVEARGNPAFCF